ncbi:FAD-dependent monooxygenase [Streptomyces sp. NPDC060322]|uniref:FAD-dependent monooxygenase n=1 Tax=Streptomyces sp. NPDC060322 TaxID=3347097 RepID=UPI003656B2DF
MYPWRASGFGQRPEHLPPAVSDRPDLGVDGVDHQVEQLVLAGDVAVQPHRTDIQLGGHPVGLTWPPKPDVTLVGDAAHLMPPVGEGANMALLDGALLALALVAHPGDVPAAIREYEREMFQRTGDAARMSADLQELLMSPDAGRRMLEFFQPDGI